MESDTKNIFMFEIFCFLRSAIITGANKTKKTFFECYYEFSENKNKLQKTGIVGWIKMNDDSPFASIFPNEE